MQSAPCRTDNTHALWFYSVSLPSGCKELSAGSVPVLRFSLAVALLVVVTAYHCFYSVRYLVIFLIDH